MIITRSNCCEDASCCSESAGQERDAAEAGPKRVVLVSGFLGAGKTTLLNRLTRHLGHGTAFVVNEFAPHDVDALLIREANGSGIPVVPIPGGSVFCRCLSGRFAETLEQLADREDVQRIVVEASGIADPAGADTLIEEYRLGGRVTIDRVITVIDPGTVEKVMHTLEAARRQIEVADVVVINKCDVRSLDEIARARTSVSAINPLALICQATCCDIPLESALAGGRCGGATGSLTPCREEGVYRIVLPVPGRVSVSALRASLDEAGELWRRVKGVIETPHGPAVVDASQTGVNIRDYEGEPAEAPALVMIGPSDREGEARALCESILGLSASNKRATHHPVVSV